VFRILIGESTWRRPGDRFRTQRIGAAVLKGKREETEIYQVLGERREDPTVGKSEGEGR
jgi:class 3 adenylate cyclase